MSNDDYWELCNDFLTVLDKLKITTELTPETHSLNTLMRKLIKDDNENLQHTS